MYLFNYELVCLTTWLLTYSFTRTLCVCVIKVETQISTSQFSEFPKIHTSYRCTMVIIWMWGQNKNTTMQTETKTEKKNHIDRKFVERHCQTFRIGTIYLLFHFIFYDWVDGHGGMCDTGFQYIRSDMSDVDDGKRVRFLLTNFDWKNISWISSSSIVQKYLCTHGREQFDCSKIWMIQWVCMLYMCVLDSSSCILWHSQFNFSFISLFIRLFCIQLLHLSPPFFSLSGNLAFAWWAHTHTHTHCQAPRFHLHCAVVSYFCWWSSLSIVTILIQSTNKWQKNTLFEWWQQRKKNTQHSYLLLSHNT